MAIFYDQVQALCKTKGITITALLKTLGYSTSKGTDWKKGSIPRGNVVNEIAAFFDVPPEYLYSGNVDEDLSYKIKMLKKRAGMTSEEVATLHLSDSFFEDHQTSDGYPILNSIKSFDLNYVWCKYCLTWHQHSGEPGHSVAHCHKLTPYKKSGYFVQIGIDCDGPPDYQFLTQKNPPALRADEVHLLSIYNALPQLGQQDALIYLSGLARGCAIAEQGDVV